MDPRNRRGTNKVTEKAGRRVENGQRAAEGAAGGCGREEGVRTVKCERESASGRAGPEGCGGEVSMK